MVVENVRRPIIGFNVIEEIVKADNSGNINEVLCGGIDVVNYRNV